jgi:hypothetical protein
MVIGGLLALPLKSLTLPLLQIRWRSRTLLPKPVIYPPVWRRRARGTGTGGARSRSPMPPGPKPWGRCPVRGRNGVPTSPKPRARASPKPWGITKRIGGRAAPNAAHETIVSSTTVVILDNHPTPRKRRGEHNRTAQNGVGFAEDPTKVQRDCEEKDHQGQFVPKKHRKQSR